MSSTKKTTPFSTQSLDRDFAAIRESISSSTAGACAAGLLLIKWTGLPEFEKPLPETLHFELAPENARLTLQDAQARILGDGKDATLKVSTGQLSRYRLQAVASTLAGENLGRPAATALLREQGYLAQVGESARGGRKSKGETELRAEVVAALERLQDLAKGRGAKARKAVYAAVAEQLSKLS